MVDTAMKMNPPQELNQLYVINGIDGNNAPFETTCLFILASPLVFFFFSLSICSGWSKSICGLVCRGCGVLGGVFGFLGIKSALVASFPYRHIYLH